MTATVATVAAVAPARQPRTADDASPQINATMGEATRTRIGLRATIVVAGLVGGAGGFGVAAAAALAPSRVIVFGDSLSDMGNVASATLGIVPGSTYYGGRFSNGPVWAERLASNLGAGPLAASTAGGNNFAYGGALTSGAGGVGGLFIRDLDEQLADYFATRVVDPQALYVVWVGANDLFDGQTDVTVPVGRNAAALEALVTAGARQFLVPNLPLLGRIPEYNRDPTASAAFDRLARDYNAALEARIEQIAAAHLQATFHRLDVAAIFTDAVDHPARWGLVNARDPAAPGLNPGALFYNRSRIVPNPGQYLFWDAIHPTAAVHAILGDYASRLLEGLPGDFDADGEVDARDLQLLRSGFGAAGAGAVRRQGDADGDGDADGADFLAWQRNAGRNVMALVAPRVAAVPEPAAVGHWAIGVYAIDRARRRARRRRRGA